MRRIIAILVFLTAYPLFSQEKNDQFTVHDFLAMTQISSPQFAPNGKNIACVIGKKESWDAARVNNIWIIAADGSEEKQITNSEKADWNPRWSPDGSKIAFMSVRSGKTQVYIIPIDGGEAQRITWCEEGVNIYDWIGNNRIFFVTNAPRDSLIVAREKEAGGGYVVGTKARKSVLWIQAIADKSDKTKIVGGKYYISDVEVSAGGNLFAMIVGPDSDLYNNFVSSKIVVVDNTGKQVFGFDQAKVFSDIDFSPNGKKISFIGNTVGGVV